MDYINAITLFANYIFIPGLSYGCQLALGALGITIVYTVLRFSNFAHGEFMSFGAMISIIVMWYFQDFGISGNFFKWMLFFSSLFKRLKISSVVKDKIGANHFNKISRIIFKNIIVDFLLSLSNVSQYKASFLISK